jgi:hypothetical protein
MYGGKIFMKITAQTVGFRLRHRVILQVDVDILNQCAASIFKPYQHTRTKGNSNQKPITYVN